MKKNSLEAQLAEAEALLAKRDAMLKAWDEGPEGKKLRELEAVETKAEEALDEARERYSALYAKTGRRLGVMDHKAAHKPSAALLTRVRDHVGLLPDEPLDAMPGLNSFRGSRETGERLLLIAARDLMDMIIRRDPEVRAADKEVDRLRTIHRAAMEAESHQDDERRRIRNGMEFWRLEETIRGIKERIANRDIRRPSTPEAKQATAAQVERLRAIRDELAALAEWAYRSGPAPKKPFTWEKP